jgi:hypothetical protein
MGVVSGIDVDQAVVQIADVAFSVVVEVRLRRVEVDGTVVAGVADAVCAVGVQRSLVGS